MPRPKNPDPKLKFRKARYDKNGKLESRGYWFVYDDGRQVTHDLAWGFDLRGLGEGDREAAEGARRVYIAKKYAEDLTSGPPKHTPAWQMPIADVLAYYSVETEPRYLPTNENPRGKRKQHRDFLNRIEALLEFWGAKMVSEINKKSCKAYAARHTPSTALRHLQDLSAAVHLAMDDEEMEQAVVSFWYPPAPKSRFRFFTRSQLAEFVWTAYRKRGTYTHSGKRSRPENRGKTVVTNARPRRHVARFALFGAATGTRKDRMEQTTFVKMEGHPWIDLENGIYYRSWDKEMVPDNKRANPLRLPDRILAHCRRWHRMGAIYLIERPTTKGGNKEPEPIENSYFRHLKEMIPDDAERKGLNIHALKHTCATWLCVAGVPMHEIADYLSTDERTIRRVYGQNHPDHHGGVGEAMTRGTAGRPRSRRQKEGSPQRQTTSNSPAVAAEARQGIRDLLDVADAPSMAFTVLDGTPDAGLVVLREQVKRAARSKNWGEVLGVGEAAEA
ncbi:hypothetical protein [Aquibium microcysteis]|uniref:hypothetical protein n=1 Tax=Aquibium microcysteis TaxID=675281 RepID=UPI00165CF82D|nr:hypothetical protein [Aquibium microcysteis]